MMTSRERAFAFFSHDSAIEVLRARGTAAPRWPSRARLLPSAGGCIHNQRGFRELALQEDLAALGISSQPADLIVGKGQGRSFGKRARFHVWGSPIPPNSMLRASERLLVSGPELAVLQLASFQLKAEPLIVQKLERFHADKRELSYLGIDERPIIDHPLKWERFMRLVRIATIAMELAGTYRLSPGELLPNYKAAPIMSMASLMETAGFAEGFFGATRAQRIAEMAADGSASPMETSLFLMLTLPVEWGGYGLPRPVLNHTLDISQLRGSLASGDVITPDLLWGERLLALEYESDAFHRKWHRPKLSTDAERANTLSTLGYTVLRATPSETLDLGRLTMLARQISVLLGRGVTEPDALGQHRRRLLHAELFPVSWRQE